MKHIKKFNESKGDTLTMSDVKEIKFGKELIKDYGWEDDQVLEIGWSQLSRGNIEVNSLLADRSEIGCAVTIDGVIKYLIGIYEMHGCKYIEKRNLLVVYGHDGIKLLWLEDGGTDYVGIR